MDVVILVYGLKLYDIQRKKNAYDTFEAKFNLTRAQFPLTHLPVTHFVISDQTTIKFSFWDQVG